MNKGRNIIDKDGLISMNQDRWNIDKHA